VSAIPNVFLAGEHQTRVLTLDLPLGGAAGDGLNVRFAAEGNDTGFESVSKELQKTVAAAESEEPDSKRARLRFGVTRWGLSAVDDQSNDERWSLTFQEIGGIASQPVPVSAVESWQGRILIDGNSVRLRTARQVGSPPGSCSSSNSNNKNNNGDLSAECSSSEQGAADDTEEDEDSAQQLTYTFGSEVLAALVYAEVDNLDGSNSSFGLQAVARAAAVLPRLPGIGHLLREQKLLPAPGTTGHK
ncbi:unnamed protein product, partial [Polarella glacialis]